MRNVIRKIYNAFPSARFIMVHHVTDAVPLVQSVPLSTENYTAFLAGQTVVPVASLLKRVRKNTCAITFDDALDDLYTTVYPIMKERGLPFTAFISAELIGQPGYITQEQLVEMSRDPLVTIGSHGCTHRHLDTCTDDVCEREIRESKRILEALTGQPIRWIAYPFGDAGRREFAYAKAVGYTHGFGVRPRAYNFLAKRSMRWLLPRYDLSDATAHTLG